MRNKVLRERNLTSIMTGLPSFIAFFKSPSRPALPRFCLSDWFFREKKHVEHIKQQQRGTSNKFGNRSSEEDLCAQYDILDRTLWPAPQATQSLSPTQVLMQEGHCHKSTNIVTKMYRISKPSKRKEIVELELGDSLCRSSKRDGCVITLLTSGEVRTPYLSAVIQTKWTMSTSQYYLVQITY